MALIFGVIAVFVAILFVLQRSDLEKVAGGDAKAVQLAVAEGGGKVEGGLEGIVVARKGGGQADWLCDLWLAERLADAA